MKGEDILDVFKKEASFLLDENIPPTAKSEFEKLGYKNVYHIAKDLAMSGVDDEKVLSKAIEMEACLCTCNGKDFIIQIPPKVISGCTDHEGLFWNKNKQGWTRKANENICKAIDEYLEMNVINTLRNHIIYITKSPTNTSEYVCSKSYPL